MPRPTTKTPEVPQRPSPTLRGPRHLRTSSSDSDPLHQRPVIDKSPRFMDRRSPRGTQSDPQNQKKLGTRITDLETQLVQAQHELKSLKHQLASAERAKKQAQEELHSKKVVKRPTSVTTTTKRVIQRRENKPPPVAEEEILPLEEDNSLKDKPVEEDEDEDVGEEISQETDVFEVPVEKMLVADMSSCSLEDDDTKETKMEKPSSCNETDPKMEELEQLRAKMEEKEKEMQVVVEENETLKKQLEEARAQIVTAQGKEEEMTSKLNQLGRELDTTKANESRLKEKVASVEEEKEGLEAEMKKMKVQTEQWRKAADAAAAVLAGGSANVNGRISGRCASMDNHLNGMFEPPVTIYGGGYLGATSPGDGNEGDKKKNSGIRMLGDLWKKKGGQK